MLQSIASIDPQLIDNRREFQLEIGCYFERRAERSEAGRQSKWSPMRARQDAERA